MRRIRGLLLAAALCSVGCATTGAELGVGGADIGLGLTSQDTQADQAQQINQETQDEESQRWADQEAQENQATQAMSQAIEQQINDTSAQIFQTP